MYDEIYDVGAARSDAGSVPAVLLHGALSGIGTSFGELLPVPATRRQVMAVDLKARHRRPKDWIANRSAPSCPGPSGLRRLRHHHAGARGRALPSAGDLDDRGRGHPAPLRLRRPPRPDHAAAPEAAGAGGRARPRGGVGHAGSPPPCEHPSRAGRDGRVVKLRRGRARAAAGAPNRPPAPYVPRGHRRVSLCRLPAHRQVTCAGRQDEGTPTANSTWLSRQVPSTPMPGARHGQVACAGL